MLSISLFSIALVSIGTYALWNAGSDLLTGSNTIQSGQVKMSYTEENSLKLDNALPMKDEDGKKLDTYFDFTVSSWIKTNKSDSTERWLSYNIVLEPTVISGTSDDETYESTPSSEDWNNVLSYAGEMFKVYLTTLDADGNEKEVTGPILINELDDYILKSQEETFFNGKEQVDTKYRLRAWIDFSVDPVKMQFTEISTQFKFRVNINSKVNPPFSPKDAITFALANVGENGLEMITHEVDDTLQVDSKFATEYRYRGGNVANYVKFNDELWRIIGIIPTEDTNGNVENRFKIIRDESIGNYKWNENNTSDWTNATLNTYLNNDYYNTLTDDAKNMIGTTKYYLGGYSDTTITTDVMWQYERKEANGSDCTLNDDDKYGVQQVGTQCYYYQNNSIIQNDASKKIALMYASDYGYGASKECADNLLNYRSPYCINPNNWLDKGADTWLLSQNSKKDRYVLYLMSDGRVNPAGVVDMYFLQIAVRPTLTLSSNVKISGGSGTKSDPYLLSIK